MNTGEIHNTSTQLQDRPTKSPQADVLTNTENGIDNPFEHTNHPVTNETTKPEAEDKEGTEQDKSFIIEQFKELIVQEFDQFNNGIERFNWMQRDVEAHIRSMLHIVNSEHQKDSQVERMVASVARDIAEATISEDLQGETARSGYNKQFFAETQRLADSFRNRLVEIVSALEQTKAEVTDKNQSIDSDEAVRKSLQHELSTVYDSHEELLRLFRFQRDTIKAQLESFRQLQYFQTEEVWQNQVYRLLNQYCEQALAVIEAQIVKLREQSKIDENQIASLIKESQLLTTRLRGDT